MGEKERKRREVKRKERGGEKGEGCEERGHQ